MNIEQKAPLIKNDNSTTCYKKCIVLLILIIIVAGIATVAYIVLLENKENERSPTDEDIANFIETIDGDVYQPSDSEYNIILSSVWNRRHRFNPLLIVLPLNSNDIMKTLDFRNEYLLSFSILGGGHNSVGWSINNGIVLSMQYFKHISIVNIDNNTKALSIGAGNRWYNVYNYMIDNNLSSYIITGGICPSVGIVGFTLGGGISGVSSREFGINLDNTLEYEIVIANGSKYILNNDSITIETDDNMKHLWWSLKGGGGNNFGVVTNLMVKLYEPNNINITSIDNRYVLVQYIVITAYNSSYNNIDQVVDLLVFMNELQDNLPRFIATFIILYFQDNNLILYIRIACNNNRRICNNLLEPFHVYLNNNTNILYTLQERYNYFIDALFGYTTNENMSNYNDQKVYLKSGYISNNGLEFNIWNITLNTMIKRPYYPYNQTQIIFEQLGGKVSDVSNQETAYYNRENIKWICQILNMYFDNVDVIGNDVIEWINVLYTNIEQYFFGAYVNYMDEYLDDWQTKYYGTNYQKLQCVKQLYDPSNIFQFAQSIQINKSLLCDIII